jgi:rRNA maturation protein Nop10
MDSRLEDLLADKMSKKRYRVKGACPHCGCGTVSHLSAGEIKVKTIDGYNLEVNCPECMEAHKASIRSVCPEYADECHL